MKKILFYTDCRFFAGCENMLVQFNNSEILKKDFKITFSYRHSDEYLSGLKKRGINSSEWIPLKFADLSNPDFLKINLPFIIKRTIMFLIRRIINPFLFIYEVIKIRQLIKKTEPDIIHINAGGFPVSLSHRACIFCAHYFSSAKKILVINNKPVGYSKCSRIIDYINDKFILSSIDIFITGSKYTRKRFLELFNVNESKIVSIPNGTNIRKYSDCSENKVSTLNKSGERVYFGVIGLLIPRKGHEIAFKAIKYLKSKNSNIENKINLIIEGEGDNLELLKKKTEEMGIADICKFVGNTENIFDLINFIDILIFPSVKNEDFPNIILESMSMSKPVIASKIAGVPEQIKDKMNGLLFEINDYKTLADHILHFVNNRKLIQVYGKNAKKIYANNYTPERSVKNYIKIYGKLLENSY